MINNRVTDLEEQVDSFVQNHIERCPGHLFLSDCGEELDKLLLPANFQEKNGVYLRENEEGVQMLTVDNVFEYRMQEIRPMFPGNIEEMIKTLREIRIKPREIHHYLALLQLNSLKEVEDFQQRKNYLSELTEREGITHRGMDIIDANRKKYICIETLKHVPLTAGAGALIGCASGSLAKVFVYGGAVGVITASISAFRTVKGLRALDKKRSDLKQEYQIKHEELKADYNSRTLFDKEALQTAVGLYF